MVAMACALLASSCVRAQEVRNLSLFVLQTNARRRPMLMESCVTLYKPSIVYSRMPRKCLFVPSDLSVRLLSQTLRELHEKSTHAVDTAGI